MATLDILENTNDILKSKIDLLNKKEDDLDFLDGLDTEFLCKAFNVTTDLKNEKYTSVKYASGAIPGCAALILSQNKLTKKEQADISIKKGARLIISDEQIEDYPCLIIPKLNNLYTSFYKKYRRLFDITSIAITGSVGKSTVTSMVAEVMKLKFSERLISSLYSSNGSNYNTFFSAIESLQKVSPKHEFIVQEIAESSTFMKGPIKNPSLCSELMYPKYSVITKIGTNHLEYFGTVENIVKECFSIQFGMPEDGILFLNADDELQQNVETKVKTKTYGIRNKADYSAKNIKTTQDGIIFDIQYTGGGHI